MTEKLTNLEQIVSKNQKNNGKRGKRSGKKLKAAKNVQKKNAAKRAAKGVSKGGKKNNKKNNKKNKTKKNKKDKKKKNNQTKKMNYTDAAYLVGGVFREMQGKMANDFINCFKGINGTAIYKAPTNPEKEVISIEQETKSLVKYFEKLDTIIEFVCLVKNKLIQWLKNPGRRLVKFMRFTETKTGNFFEDIKAFIVKNRKNLKEKVSGKSAKLNKWKLELWNSIKVKYVIIKIWMKNVWVKLHKWLYKTYYFISKFKRAKNCSGKGKQIDLIYEKDKGSKIDKALKKQIKEMKSKVKTLNFIYKDINKAVVGNAGSLAKLFASVLCAIPNIIRIVRIYRDKNKKRNKWEQWGRILGRLILVFTSK